MRWRESNPRQLALKASALPTELHPWRRTRDSNPWPPDRQSGALPLSQPGAVRYSLPDTRRPHYQRPARRPGLEEPGPQGRSAKYQMNEAPDPLARDALSSFSECCHAVLPPLFALRRGRRRGNRGLSGPVAVCPVAQGYATFRKGHRVSAARCRHAESRAEGGVYARSDSEIKRYSQLMRRKFVCCRARSRQLPDVARATLTGGSDARSSG